MRQRLISLGGLFMNNKSTDPINAFALEHFLRTTNDLIFFKDCNSIYTSASLPFALLLGKEDPSDIIGKTEHDLFPKEYADNYLKSDALLLDGTEKSVTDITPISLPDGSQGHMLITKTPIRDEKGNICGICGIGNSYCKDSYGTDKSQGATSCIFDYSIAEDILHIQINNGAASDNLHIENYQAQCGKTGIIHPDSAELLKFHLNRARTEVCQGSFNIVCNLFGSGFMLHCVHYKTLTDNNKNIFRVIGQISNIHKEKKRELLVENLAGQMMQRAKNISYDPDIVSNVFSLMYNSNDLDKTIESVLESIGTYYGVSRAYIFEDHESHLYCKNTFEWCAPGIEPQKDFLQKYEYQFENGQNVYIKNFDEEGLFLCRDIHSLPQDQIDVLEPQGIYSMIQCAMLDDGVFSGFVGFDECSHERVWTGEQIGTLTLISRLLSTFIVKRHRKNDAAFTADFMSALDQNASFVYIVDPNSYEIIFCNQVIRETFGSDFVSQKCHKAFLNSDTPCNNCPIKLFNDIGRPQAIEILRPDGMWVLSQASPMHWQGRDMMMVTSTDITRHMSATEELRIRNEEYSIVMKQSGKHIFRFDIPSGKISRFYDFSLVYGQRTAVPDTPDEIVAQGLVSPDTVEEYKSFFESMKKQIPTGSANIHVLQGDGIYRWFRYDYTLVDNQDGSNAVSAIVSIGDIDAETKAILDLTRRAERDGMTGLYNKAATEEIVMRVISMNIDEPCALMVIDLDNLKTINDTLGHAAGDDAIKTLTSVIRDHFRNTDIVGRIGGDEFMVLLHGAISESVLRTSLSGLIRKVSRRKIGQTDSILSCSIGAAFGTCGSCTYEALFKQADTALYHVKRNGKRGFALYTSDMEKEDYFFTENNRLTLNKTEWFDTSELAKLFAALSILYPLVISVNLTKNCYYMMEYDTFKSKSCPDSGIFDDLIKGGAMTYHPDDRQSFIAAFSREQQLDAYKSGKKTIVHTGRQLGDDGIMRLIKTVVIFTEDKSGDICQITLSKPL